MRISIIVAVFNPGPALDIPVGSFLRQTMPRDEFEVIFVDDGSTDGSGKRLDQLARRHPHFRVIHIPNSGWPGRPRNLGIDDATGRYVLFVDHDDWLADDALAYLWEIAERERADVLAPREIGHGFGVPRRMFRRTILDAELGRDDILALLTPHKLFRRSMLVEHGIRFPEGPRRLEDHHFVIQAYFAARRIIVTGDHPVYHWAKRDEGTNATGMPFAHELYYDNLRDILDIVDRNTEPGELRDRLYAHWLRYKMIHKLLRPRFRTPGTRARALYEEVRRLMDDRFPAAVDRFLPVGYRVVARAVRADRFEVVVAAANLAHDLRLEVETRDVRVDGERVEIDLEHELRTADGPVELGDQPTGRVWVPPAALVEDLALDSEDLRVDPAEGELAIVARHRGLSVDYDEAMAYPGPGDVAADGRLAGRATFVVDPATFAAGAPLPEGTWETLLTAEFGGFRATRRVQGLSAIGATGRRVRTTLSSHGHLAIVVGDPSAGRATPSRPRAPGTGTPAPGIAVRARAAARRLLPPPARRLVRRALDRVRG
ncbi:MAG TPA: glycosyltransferase family A protein [Candidatus Angelobacter sp.]|nr:glycosyltransferase family A protein [Candidatus Angelobacter sp.]